jgi:hypothetical protein
MYLGTAAITADGTNELENTVNGLIDDYNNDGEKNVDYLELTAASGDTTEALMQRFQAEVAAGDSVIYLIDENYYKELLELGVLSKLSDVLDDSDMPATTIDEYGVYVKELAISGTAGFDELPDSTILCIRRSPEQDEIKYNKKIDVYNANKQCFIKLITYKAVQDESE